MTDHTTQLGNSATITVGDFAIPIQMLAATDAADAHTPGHAAQPKIVPLAEWPISPAVIAHRANAVLVDKHGKPHERRDCAWAIAQLEINDSIWPVPNDGRHGPMYLIREAQTQTQWDAQHHRDIRAYLRGDDDF